MNFLESTNFFVRVIMFDFVNRNEDIKLKFRLAPMVHIGTRDYYEEVFQNIKNCDELFYEGMNMKKLSFSFRQYKTIANKLGLVTQNEYFRLRAFNGKLTHTDFDVKAGMDAWDELTFKEKVKLRYIEPFELFLFQRNLTRKGLAKNFMTSRDEAYLAYGPIEDEAGTSANLKMNKREQIIFKNIKNRIASESAIEKTIGIIYGASHMESIARCLIDKFHYVPQNAKFVKVFNVE